MNQTTEDLIERSKTSPSYLSSFDVETKEKLSVILLSYMNEGV